MQKFISNVNYKLEWLTTFYRLFKNTNFMAFNIRIVKVKSNLLLTTNILVHEKNTQSMTLMHYIQSSSFFNLPVKILSLALIIWFFFFTVTHRWIIANIVAFITILCINSGNS